MSATSTFALIAGVYFGLNFLCALLLHLHARHQAHLPLRFLDVAMHFVLLTLFAMPALAYVLVTAVFGGGREALPYPARATPAARAA